MNSTMTKDEYLDLVEEFIDRLEANMSQLNTLLKDPTYDIVFKGEQLSVLIGVYSERIKTQVQTTILGNRLSVLTNVKNLCTDIDPELMGHKQEDK